MPLCPAIRRSGHGLTPDRGSWVAGASARGSARPFGGSVTSPPTPRGRRDACRRTIRTLRRRMLASRPTGVRCGSSLGGGRPMERDPRLGGRHRVSCHAVSSGTPDEEDVRRAKSAVAAAIAVTLAARGLTMRAAAAELHLDAADVQRIRNGEIGRFTLDRLVRVASRLGHRVDLCIAPSALPGAGA